MLLPKNQLANALNTTVRGTFVRPRPPFSRISFDTASQALLDSGLASGAYQGGSYFQPDNAEEGIMISVGGRIFQITPSDTTATVVERTIPGDPNPSSQPIVWMWQSEAWMNVTDGASLPLFIDNTTTVRSTYNAPVTFTTTTSSSLTIPAIAAAGSVDFTDVSQLVIGEIVTVQDKGQLVVNDIVGNTVSFVNNTMTPTGQVLASPVAVSWQHLGNELPPGRMGTYGMGRNWMVLTDGKQFVASDIVGGSSGTPAENYRDSVKHITENSYLAGGGFFTVPGQLGSITFMRFTATLDASLGQGPLQVGTHSSIFSCNAPVDRSIWQSITNPILTESLIANGGLGQNSTINVNGDIIFRSLNGIRSLVLARREFNTWGNVPQSREIEPLLSRDSPDFLPYGSAIFFDNRLLMTATPIPNDKGVYHTALVAMNADPISSLQGKAPPVYDALRWSGLNILQLFWGEFSGIERAFAVCLNLKDEDNPFLELYEILKSASSEFMDNGEESIIWTFESPVIFGPQTNPRRKFLQLWDGEIYVDQVKGTVKFQAYYKPDQLDCWSPWHKWEICSDVDAPPGKAQFRPQMGLGQPDPSACDDTNNRIMCQGFSFQVKFVITGHCRFLGARFKAKAISDPAFSPMICEEVCET